MKALDASLIKELASHAKVNKSFQKRLSISSLSGLSIVDWGNHEMVSLPTKDGSAGIMIIERDNRLYVVPYQISVISDKSTGRSKPVICDFCKTWQAGGRAGSITFPMKRRSLDSVSFLCCYDLECSLHVRDLTPASKISRAQLRENITPEYRIDRLRKAMSLLIERLGLEPLSK